MALPAPDIDLSRYALPGQTRLRRGSEQSSARKLVGADVPGVSLGAAPAGGQSMLSLRASGAPKPSSRLRRRR